MLQRWIWQEAVLLAKSVEGDGPAVGPLTPELAQAIKLHKQPLKGRNLGRKGGQAPLLQQSVGLVNSSTSLHVSRYRLLKRRGVALQIGGFGDRLAEPGGGGDQLPGLVAGGIPLEPEGVTLLLAIAAQTLGSPLGSAAELLAMESIESGIENRCFLKAEGVNPAQVLRLGQLPFLCKQEFGFISGALIEGCMPQAQVARQLAAAIDQSGGNGLGGLGCTSMRGAFEVVDVFDHQGPTGNDEGQVIELSLARRPTFLPMGRSKVDLCKRRHHCVADRCAQIVSGVGLRGVGRTWALPVPRQGQRRLHGTQELIAGIG